MGYFRWGVICPDSSQGSGARRHVFLSSEGAETERNNCPVRKEPERRARRVRRAGRKSNAADGRSCSSQARIPAVDPLAADGTGRESG